ncbi:hypothetical protein MKZ38_004781 [Zalerion maritima]|uniref:Uncharacterized protein n=1 Tax=Zalerion maritima TaxID=339359 RepID=A0AAD5RLP0_9PEZI|nr:hypothetical protein MKZ38_004781 [Zalerion maritima]
MIGRRKELVPWNQSGNIQLPEFLDEFYSATCVASSCAVTSEFFPGSPCESAWTWGQIEWLASIQPMTDHTKIESMLSRGNEDMKEYIQCQCNNDALEPWLSGPQGVCDDACQGSGEEGKLERIYRAWSSVCAVVGIEATTTAEGEVSEETGTGPATGTGNGEGMPEETAPADGDDGAGDYGDAEDEETSGKEPATAAATRNVAKMVPRGVLRGLVWLWLML